MQVDGIYPIQVLSMADANPTEPPNAEFYGRIFELLMKYDDWRGKSKFRSR